MLGGCKNSAVSVHLGTAYALAKLVRSATACNHELGFRELSDYCIRQNAEVSVALSRLGGGGGAAFVVTTEEGENSSLMHRYVWPKPLVAICVHQDQDVTNMRKAISKNTCIRSLRILIVWVLKCIYQT